MGNGIHKMKVILTSLCSGIVVVVFLPIPMEGMGRLQISDLFTELPVPPQAAGVIGTFKCDFYYISFSVLRSHFLQGLHFMYAFPLFLQVHFACALCI